MANGNGNVPISWMTVATACTVVGLMAAAGWTIFQNEFANVKDAASADRKQAAIASTTNRDDLIRYQAEMAINFNKYLTKDEHKAFLASTAAQLENLDKRVANLEILLGTALPKLARDPVEQRTIDAIKDATDKRIDLIQAQITDINRQIAAALIIIDNNAVSRKTLQPPP